MSPKELALQSILARLQSLAHGAPQEVGPSAQQVYSELMDVAEKADEEEAALAVRALTRTVDAPPSVFDFILRHVSQKDSHLREPAIIALAEFAERPNTPAERVVEALVKALVTNTQNPCDELRHAPITEALLRYRPAALAAVPKLEQLLRADFDDEGKSIQRLLDCLKPSKRGRSANQRRHKTR